MSLIFKPHDNQLEALQHLYKLKRSALWMPMGGGKTVSSLTALVNMDLAGDDIFPVLVLGPKRVVQTTWADEVKKWAHTEHLQYSYLGGTPLQRSRVLHNDAEIHGMAYDNLSWLVDTLGANWPYKTVIADELTRLKSFRIRQGSKRAGALGKVAHTKVERFIGLTGTPSPNGLKDLWGQSWFLDKGERLGKTFSAFETRWFTKGYDGYSLEAMPHAQKEIEDKLRDLCLTITGLTVDEPIKTPVFVDLPPAARATYREMEKHMLTELAGIEIAAELAVTKTNKLLQIANGACYTDDQGNWAPVHDAKLDALESIVEEAGGMPILVSYQFKSDLARILKRFPGARHLDDDPKTIRDWNKGKIPMLVAHPACLHPSTEVLTEFRGWVKIIDVEPSERVFDGVEFVVHAGCSFSGISEIVEACGLWLTPQHKLLVGGNWKEANDVRRDPSAREEALYSYTGDDDYLGAMLPLRSRAGASRAECSQGEQGASSALRAVLGGDIPPHDGYPFLVDMAPHGEQSNKPSGQGFSEVRRDRTRRGPHVAEIRELSARHAEGVHGPSNVGPTRQLAGLQQEELSLGAQPETAIEQGEQSSRRVWWPYAPSRRVLPGHADQQGRDNPEAGQGSDRGRGGSGLQALEVQAPSQISDVYDLVDCGPRNRFLVRNAAGEVFISHNSAGHGLNLQDGGNILVFFSLDWSLEGFMQIIERIGPMRQKQSGYDRPVFLYFIMARGTVDEVVMERLEGKKTLQESLLEALKRAKEDA